MSSTTLPLEATAAWRKSMQYIASAGSSLDALLHAPPEDSLLQKVRLTNRFVILEGKTDAFEPNHAYLFDAYTLQILKPSVSDAYMPHIGQHVADSMSDRLRAYPPTVEIATSNVCNRKCLSCVQGYVAEAPSEMAPNTWRAIVDQLSSYFATAPSSEQPIVHLHWYNEPLMDKSLLEKMGDLRLANVNTVVLITNGDYLREEQVPELTAEAALVVVSAKNVKVFERFDAFTDSEVPLIAIDHSRYHSEAQGYNRGGIVPIRNAKKVTKCSKGFNIQIDTDGTIYACCNDMGKSLPLTTVQETGMFDVWNGERMQTMRTDLRQGVFASAPCATCEHNYG